MKNNQSIVSARKRRIRARQESKHDNQQSLMAPTHSKVSSRKSNHTIFRSIIVVLGLVLLMYLLQIWHTPSVYVLRNDRGDGSWNMKETARVREQELYTNPAAATGVIEEPLLRTGEVVGDDSSHLTEEEPRRDKQEPSFPVYTTETIARTVLTNIYQPTRLLIYSNSTVQLFSLGNKNDPKIPDNLKWCRRCEYILPLLVPALLELENLPPFFQLLFSDADFTYNSCICTSKCKEDTRSFAPVLQFGSVLKNYTAFLPTVLPYPTPKYLNCLREWRLNTTVSHCTNWRLPNVSSSSSLLQDLKPQLIWRGTKYTFLLQLHNKFFKNEYSIPRKPFSPRFYLSRKTNATPWLDVQVITGTKIKSEQYMSQDDMARYRYQVDLGGAGGTTWTGTIEKLSMPGVLFHHETPAMDWFYDDLLIPWKHYVPIRTDLSDLEEKHEWAETHPNEAQAITDAASALVHDFFSPAQMERQYQRHFQDYLGRVVNAYRHDDTTGSMVDSILTWYTEQGLDVEPLGSCSRDSCSFSNKVKAGQQSYKDIPFDAMP